MKCPTCKDTNLSISERKGIEIDFCPQCRGIWLDRGELDKILERSRADEPAVDRERERDHDRDRDRDRDVNYRQHQEQKHYYKRRKSFFEELFD